MSDILAAVEDTSCDKIRSETNNDNDQKLAAVQIVTQLESDRLNNTDEKQENLETSMDQEITLDQQLTPDQQVIYDATVIALNEALTEFLPCPIPKVVSVDLIQELVLAQSAETTTPDPNDSIATSSLRNVNHSSISARTSTTVTLPTTTTGAFTTTDTTRTSIPLLSRHAGGGGHRNEILLALDELEGLEKEEQQLAYKTSLTRYLTELVTGETYDDSTSAIKSIIALEDAVPRRVCQHPFRKNDIVWVCRTCQADETCVLCHACFSQSNHDGHDVAFYHAQAGGCCDCGDPDGTFLVC
jgi:Putative zinc finger in N-recognin (UBR box)